MEISEYSTQNHYIFNLQDLIFNANLVVAAKDLLLKWS